MNVSSSSERRRRIATRRDVPKDAHHRRRLSVIVEDTTRSAKEQSLITQYNKEAKVYRQEYNTQEIQNIQLQRDLDDDLAELEEVQRDYLIEKEKHDKQVAFALNPQEDEYYEEEIDPDLQLIEVLGVPDLDLINHRQVDNGARVGEYQLSTMLNNGAFGRVFKGFHRETKEECAIKVIDKDKIQGLVNEITVLLQITHPNIVHTAQMYHATNTVYVVMQLASMDLLDYIHKIEKIPLSDSTLREIMLGILKPLEHLHSLGICHSDIKPENVLVTTSYSQQRLTRKHVKLCDFGLCSISKSTDPNDPVWQHDPKGTVPLIAPEVVTSETTGHYDARPADMWAVGCTILELSDGYPEEWKETYEHGMNHRYRDFETGIEECLEQIRYRYYVVNDNAHDIVLDLLRMNPRNRLTASQVLSHHWFGGTVGKKSTASSFVETEPLNERAESRSSNLSWYDEALFEGSVGKRSTASSLLETEPSNERAESRSSNLSWYDEALFEIGSESEGEEQAEESDGCGSA